MITQNTSEIPKFGCEFNSLKKVDRVNPPFIESELIVIPIPIPPFRKQLRGERKGKGKKISENGSRRKRKH